MRIPLRDSSLLQNRPSPLRSGGRKSLKSCRGAIFLKFWLPVYLYAVLIFIYSSLSQPPLAPKVLHADKLLHLLEYAILGYLIGRAAKNSPSLKLRAHFRILAVVLSFLYGLSDELHQYFVPGREAEILDALTNGAGAFIGQMFLKG